MKTILIFALLLFEGVVCQAQITSVLIGVNGLTCSQCTRNVEMQLRKLPFVADVTMNLQHTNGIIRLKDQGPFIPERIVTSVQDAGFSIRYLKIVVNHPEQYHLSGSCATISGLGIQVVGAVPQPVPQPLCLQILGEHFQPGKDIPQLPKRTCAGSRYFATLSPEEAQ